MQVILANPRGFCAGVVRAIDIVESSLNLYGPPIYVLHEIVHNKYVLTGLRQRGVVFVNDLEQIPDAAVAIFSAHGVSKEITAAARQRNLRIIDATCPLVTKVHRQVEKLCRADYEVVVIGHAGHPEISGTIGQVPADLLWRIHLVETLADVETCIISNQDRVGYVTQTTLSVDETREIIDKLKQHFPAIIAPATDDICYATQNRQEAVRALARECDVILVVGSKTSSNSNSLQQLAARCAKPAYLIDGPEEVQPEWLAGCERIGVTGGASAPDDLINNVIVQLQRWGATDIKELSGVSETVFFHPPKHLQAAKQRIAHTV